MPKSKIKSKLQQNKVTIFAARQLWIHDQYFRFINARNVLSGAFFEFLKWEQPICIMLGKNYIFFKKFQFLYEKFFWNVNQI